MIKANELRIGNRVMYCKMLAPLKGVFEEVILLPYMIEDAAERPKMYSPIPLDENWILKFGFEWKENVYWKGFNYSKVFCLYPSRGDNGFRFSTQTFMVFIKNVHELQNIYFTLTGNELEFALK